MTSHNTFVQIAFVTVVAASGCALTATAPAGPLRSGTYTSVAPTWAVAYGPAKATTAQGQVTGSGDTWGPAPNPEKMAFVPIRAGMRQALGGRFEVSGDVGWLDSGVELRTGSPDGGDTPAFAIAAGVRTSALAVAAKQKTTVGRLRFELYPELYRGRHQTTTLALAGGVSYGSFAHAMSVPTAGEADVPVVDPSIIVVRPEARLELTIGVNLRAAYFNGLVALAPWILLHAQEPSRATCLQCFPDGTVSSFSQPWGVALVVSPSLGADLLGML